MYYLIYDHLLSQPKYRKEIARLETHLTDMGVPFKTGHLTPLKNLSEFTAIAERNNAHTIVAVGGDDLINKVINDIAEKPNLTLGVIPVGGKSCIAGFLGVEKGHKACEILTARKIETLDLGKINDQYFLVAAEAAQREGVTLAFDADYSIRPLTAHQKIGVYNFNYHRPGDLKTANPQDGWLNAMIIPTKQQTLFPIKKHTLNWGKETVIPTKKVHLTSGPEPATIIADCTRIFKTPLTITVKPHSLRAIVGRNRKF